MLILFAFTLGAITAYAGTRCVQAIEAQAALKAALWDVVICSASLVVIYTHSIPAYAADVLGSSLATWWAVSHSRKKEVSGEAHRSPSSHRG